MTTAALTPLTPTELIKDIRVLDRIEHDWLIEGRLDAITEEDIKYKRGDLMDQLRQRFTTREDPVVFDDWIAWEGDYDLGIPVGYGKTELEAIETLLELIGEDA